MQADIRKSEVTILVEVNGQVHVAIMDNDNFDAVSLLAKQSTEELIRTDVTQTQLNRFLLPAVYKE